MTDTAASPQTAAAPDAGMQAHPLVEMVRELTFKSEVRPYELSAAGASLSHSVGGSVSAEALPEPGHWRLALEVEVGSDASTGGQAFYGKCAVESIILLKGFRSTDDIRAVLLHQFTGQLFALARERLMAVSYRTSYPLIQLPPLTSGELERFASKLVIDKVHTA